MLPDPVHLVSASTLLIRAEGHKLRAPQSILRWRTDRRHFLRMHKEGHVTFGGARILDPVCPEDYKDDSEFRKRIASLRRGWKTKRLVRFFLVLLGFIATIVAVIAVIVVIQWFGSRPGASLFGRCVRRLHGVKEVHR